VKPVDPKNPCADCPPNVTFAGKSRVVPCIPNETSFKYKTALLPIFPDANFKSPIYTDPVSAYKCCTHIFAIFNVELPIS
jgi:hypothetical protein